MWPFQKKKPEVIIKEVERIVEIEKEIEKIIEIDKSELRIEQELHNIRKIIVDAVDKSLRALEQELKDKNK